MVCGGKSLMNVAERVGRSAAGALTVARCLGPFRLEDGAGSPLQFRTRKARALLAVLAVQGRPMSRNALADLLWSDRADAQARASLRQTIHELQHLDSRGSGLLAIGREDVTVEHGALVTDLQLIRAASAEGDWARLLTLLESSDAGLLTDLDGLDPELDDWLRLQRAHEPAKTLAAAVDATERCACEAGPRAALDLVGEILRLDPVNEEATRLAMQFASELGDRVALNRYFAALRDRLREDYGAEPSPETAELFARLGSGRPQPPAVMEPESAAAPRVQPTGPARLAALTAIGAALVLAIAALFVLWRQADRSPSTPKGIVVAVLPFEEQQPDSSFLASGLWEQTRGALTRNTALKVLGRTTTEAMAAQKLTADDYRKRFGVTHLLEGSVRRSGNQFLVSVSLSRTSDGVTEWQDTFRGRMGEPFALQDAIADGIEGKLRARLAPGGGRKAEQIATAPEVYGLYSQARGLIASREKANIGRAEALLRQAVKLDPNYAPAWSLLGAAIYFNGRVAIDDEQARAEGLAAVRRALSMAPNFAPAYATLALVEGEQTPDAEPTLRRAVALDPSYSEAWNWLGNSLNSQGKVAEAIAAYQRAIAIDPLLYPAVINLFTTASEVGDEAAVERLEQAITRAGASPELIDSVRTTRAYGRGDFSSSLQLLSARGLDGNGHPKKLLWNSWFNALTAMGYYDRLHHITGCPEWYAPLVSGKALPPTTFENKPVTPTEFWTSVFFSAPASRAMVKLGHSRELVQLYRAGFRNADDFISQTDRRDMLAELAPNVAIALRATNSADESNYLLEATATRVEESYERGHRRNSEGRLALIRAAQGRRAEALTMLDTAIRKGWFPDGRNVAIDLAEEPAFKSFVGDPRFEVLRKRMLDHVAQERAELGPLKV